MISGDGDADPEELMSQVVDDLLADDTAANRTRLRKIELIYLAANS